MEGGGDCPVEGGIRTDVGGTREGNTERSVYNEEGPNTVVQ